VHARRCIGLLTCSLLLTGCERAGPVAIEDDPQTHEPLAISTDKAAYRPGEAVMIAISGSVAADALVRYKHMGRVVDESAVSGTAWSWVPPVVDYQGYMAEVYRTLKEGEEILATEAIDVSSDWTRFPRYGFLSDFGELDEREIHDVIADLNRHHINGLQFYDWHHKHHQMLPGTAESPQPVWKNIAGQDVHFSTVAAYIKAAHEHNMSAMFYNLIYGALKDADADGVAEQWYVFTDNARGAKDRHVLPSPPFVSDIFLLDPANVEWREYLAREVQKVYSALDFDGFHMDQLGDRGTRYAYDGTPVDLASTFEGFITSMHQEHPGKYQIMNAVDQYGQPGIAHAPTPILYTEVWPPHESYAVLAQTILDNDALSGGQKNTVLAAYVNYGLADRPGVFNTPSVLLADAVILAFGGAHLELGEHMLGKEFFPNANLAMRTDLRKALVWYYDFLVAYQNLLRDGGAFNSPHLTSSGALPLGAWPPQQGRIAFVGKEVGNRQVIHLLNFTEATTMSWRDDQGIQAYPHDRAEIPLTLATDRQIERIWYATPDQGMGASQELEYSQSGNEVSFTLPFLKYWSMIAVEYR
jgi:dextranase